jgi:hypothetical protein
MIETPSRRKLSEIAQIHASQIRRLTGRLAPLGPGHFSSLGCRKVVSGSVFASTSLRLPVACFRSQ